MENRGKKVKSEPSFILMTVLILLYFFVTTPLSIGFIKIAVLLGFSSIEIKSVISETILVIQIGVSLFLILFLLKYYFYYLFSYNIKSNLRSILKVGLTWSLPILLIHAFFSFLPDPRDIIFDRFSPYKVWNESILSLILLSIVLILGAIFEELFLEE